MKDFDQEREAQLPQRNLTFKLGGVEFHVEPYVAPETIDAFTPTKRDEGKTILDVYDEWVLSVLVKEDRPKWTKMRKDAKPPATLNDIENVVFHLVEVCTGHPYRHALILAIWAASNPGWVRGHLTLAGHNRLSLKEYIDAAYVLYVKEFLGQYDLPYMGRERAADSMLSDEDRRIKENMESLKKMGIVKS